MKNHIKTIYHDKLLEVLLQHDNRVIFEKTNIVPDEKELLNQLNKLLDKDDITKNQFSV